MVSFTGNRDAGHRPEDVRPLDGALQAAYAKTQEQAWLLEEAAVRTRPTDALTSQALPETVKIWHNGRLVVHTAANTGISASPTVDGTFPVYLRYYFQVMQGTNPDGSHYADPVFYVSYFNGGDAVHFDRRGASLSVTSCCRVQLDDFPG